MFKISDTSANKPIFKRPFVIEETRLKMLSFNRRIRYYLSAFESRYVKDFVARGRCCDWFFKTVYIGTVDPSLTALTDDIT